MFASMTVRHGPTLQVEKTEGRPDMARVEEAGSCHDLLEKVEVLEEVVVIVLGSAVVAEEEAVEESVCSRCARPYLSVSYPADLPDACS